MKNLPEISFIVVNYNGITHTRELLLSMEANLKNISYEAIVVDNGSQVNETYLLSKEYPWVITIRSEINLGFSGGNNLGIKISSGRYLMLINNDVVFVDNSICEIVKMFQQNTFIGAISPKIYFPDPPKTIQFAGFTNHTKITLRNRTIGYNELDLGQYDKPSETASTHGAAMMIRREVIEKVGLMPEIYFLYYEEFDWCAQMKRMGYQIWYQPNALIIHKESQSVGKGTYLRSYYLTRNRLLYAWRNRIGIARYLSIMYQLTFAIPKGILQSIIFGRLDLIKAYILGSFDFLLLKNKYS